MLVLSVWWGYCSGAALFEETVNSYRLLGASCEERFSRTKNTSAFPSSTVRWLRTVASNQPIDQVVFTGNDVGVDYLLSEKGSWSIEDYIKENVEYWGPVLLSGLKLDYLNYLAGKSNGNGLNTNSFPGEKFWFDMGVGTLGTEHVNRRFDAAQSRVYSELFDLPLERVTRVDHHKSHRSYAVWTHPSRFKSLLVFTCDGWGDGRNATVSKVVLDENGVLHETEIFSSKNCTLARTYRFITLLLGMKPSEHEFKVMGLASYGRSQYSRNVQNYFRSTMYYSKVVGDFVVDKTVKDSFFSFREKLIGERFDNIACGVQIWLEETLVEWVSDMVSRTGIHDIAFSGGVAMNVKAMSVLEGLPFVRTLHNPPSPGDESHIFGSYFAYRSTRLMGFDSLTSVPYFGYHNPGNSKSLQQSIVFKDGSLSLSLTSDFDKIVDTLCDGGIVGICRGSAEFGARALGNRSLLIDPANLAAKELLNSAVKGRDFWMPFAPIILDSFVDLYLTKTGDFQNKTNRFMTTLYSTTPVGRSAMRSAVHPSDGTCRAQILYEKDNPYLYRLISVYSERSGRGALLNTSFNVHGAPIVNTVEEAFSIFMNTPISTLVLDDTCICKFVDLPKLATR